MLICQHIFTMSLSTLVTLRDSHLDITMVTDVCLQVIVYNSLGQLKILKTAIKILSLYKTRITCNAKQNENRMVELLIV